MKRLFALLASLVLLCPAMADEFSPTVIRIHGDNRYDTAADASAFSFEKSQDVLVASGQAFPDALAGSALASALEAPIILTSKDSLSVTSIKEIQRLDPDRITIIGSEGAVSTNVERQLASLAPTDRIGGANRFETSALVAERVMDLKPSKKLGLANGLSFPDALTSTFYLDQNDMALVLASDKDLPDEVKAFLRARGVEEMVVFGGEKSLPSSILPSSLQLERLAGSNRFDTAVKIARATNPDPDTIILANAFNFPDALSATSVMQAYDAPIILVGADEIPQEVRDYILQVRPKRIIIVGGGSSVSQAVVDEISNMVDQARQPSLDLVPGSHNLDYAKSLGDLINQERLAKGAKELSFDEELGEMARTRAKDLSQTLSAQTRPDGSSWSSLSDKARAQYIVKLNVGPEDAFTSFKLTESIFENQENVDSMGLGLWTDEDGDSYWVLIYGQAS